MVAEAVAKPEQKPRRYHVSKEEEKEDVPTELR